MINFKLDILRLISQVEIYDQIWYVRDIPKEGKHSRKSKELVVELITRLEDIPDGGAECFPFEMIDMLKSEFFTEIYR